MRRADWWRDDAVSEVVGTILLVAISVVLFSGLSLVVWNQMQTSPLPANADLSYEVDGDWTSVTHVWGESLPVAETRFLLTVDGVPSEHRLDQEPLAGNLTHMDAGSPIEWDIGETLWLSCPANQTCAYPGKTVDDATVVDGRANAVLFSTVAGLTPGLLLNPLPDLVVATQEVEDHLTPSDPMYIGCSYRFTAVVANTGLEPTPAGSSIVTNFYLDGTPLHTDTRDDPLNVGSSYEVQVDREVLGVGPHQFRVTVDEADAGGDDAIAEIAGDPPAENAHQRSFSLVAGVTDPDFAFEDGNDDGFFSPCVANDVNNHTAIMDGAHTTPAGVGIVIPPLAGAVSPDAPIAYTAGGSLRIGVDLTANNGSAITLSAGNEIRFAGSPAPVLTATGTIDIDAFGDIVAPGVTLVAEGFPIFIDSTAGSVVADDLSVPVGASADATRFEVRAAEHVTMQDAGVNVTYWIVIDAAGTSGPDSFSLWLRGATLVADPGPTLLSGDQGIRLNGDGDVHMESAFLKTRADLIEINVDVIPNTLYYQDLECHTRSGSQNTVVLTPLGAGKSGTTTKCAVP